MAVQLRSRVLPGRQALAYIGNALLRFCPCSASAQPRMILAPPQPRMETPARSLGQDGGRGRSWVCPASQAELMEAGSKGEGKGEAKGGRGLWGRVGEVVAAPRVLGITEPPQEQGSIREAAHPGVIAIQEGVGVVLLGMVEGDALLQVCKGGGELSQPEPRYPQGRSGPQPGAKVACLVARLGSCSPSSRAVRYSPCAC